MPGRQRNLLTAGGRAATPGAGPSSVCCLFVGLMLISLPGAGPSCFVCRCLLLSPFGELPDVAKTFGNLKLDSNSFGPWMSSGCHVWQMAR